MQLMNIRLNRLTLTNSEHEKHEISGKLSRLSVDIIMLQVLKIMIGLLIYSFSVYLTLYHRSLLKTLEPLQMR